MYTIYMYTMYTICILYSYRTEDIFKNLDFLYKSVLGSLEPLEVSLPEYMPQQTKRPG